MKKTLFIFLIGGLTLITGCKDFLYRTPEAEIGSNNFFTSESALKMYVNGFIENYIPSEESLAYDGYNDIVAVSRSMNYLYTLDWQPSNQSGWSISDWNPIYNINYFIVHFREVPDLDEETYNHYEGTARFWRAWKYWDFVKTFGAVPWYDEPIDPDDYDALYKPRDNREYVMDKVLEDLNFACGNISDEAPWIDCAQISRYVALALKARVCLFEGTYRKYHSEDPSTGQPWQDTGASERFLRECVSACEELMNSGKYTIVDDGTDEGRQTQYKGLFSGKLNYDEVIWGREYSEALATANLVTNKYYTASYGYQWSLDQDFVQTYLHLDGTRHADYVASLNRDTTVTVTNQLFADEVADRDYRLQQQIYCPNFSELFPTLYSTTSLTYDFGKTITGYLITKWYSDSSYRNGVNTYNDLCAFRYAEVLLNYAEAKCELGEFTSGDWDKTIRVLRERAGVDGRQRSDIDQTLADYYGGLTNADLVEVRRERAIELLIEMPSRYDDLMRWHLGDLFNKDWYGIYIPKTEEMMDVDGDGNNDVVVVNTSHKSSDFPGCSMVNTANSDYGLEFVDHGRLTWYCPRYFEDKRYVHPIPASTMELNPALGQNYYWQ